MEASLREYIKKVRWQTAKSLDHQYTVVMWKPELEKDFRKFVGAIREHGYKEKFNGTTYTYLTLDGFTYWTMFNRVESTILVNRKTAS